MKFITAKELQSLNPDPVVWICKPWLALEAITELDGKAKTAGKTTFALAMCKAILNGEDFLGEKTTKSSIVYLTEESRSTFRSALDRADIGESENFHVLFWKETHTLQNGLADGSIWEQSIAEAVAYAKAVGAAVLIVDTFAQFARLTGDKENSAGHILEAVIPIQKARDAGLAVGIIRHERKEAGTVPVVLYREDELRRHGNFHAASYRRIQQQPPWMRRLAKVHTSARRTLMSRDTGRRELDSSNSSDALLMNVFCHPETLNKPAVRALLGIEVGAEPVFGYRPGVPLRSGRRDCTEVDLKLGDLLIEAKLTEHDFQSAPLRLVERYSGLEEVFDRRALEVVGGAVQSYQLIRCVLAAHASLDGRFCVLCDARRPDLIAAWERVLSTVQLYELRSRLQLLTWQELAQVLPTDLREFLNEKFGIN